MVCKFYIVYMHGGRLLYRAKECLYISTSPNSSDYYSTNNKFLDITISLILYPTKYKNCMEFREESNTIPEVQHQDSQCISQSHTWALVWCGLYQSCPAILQEGRPGHGYQTPSLCHLFHDCLHSSKADSRWRFPTAFHLCSSLDRDIGDPCLSSDS